MRKRETGISAVVLKFPGDEWSRLVVIDTEIDDAGNWTTADDWRWWP